jgi:hypothetical protein
MSDRFKRPVDSDTGDLLLSDKLHQLDQSLASETDFHDARGVRQSLETLVRRSGQHNSSSKTNTNQSSPRISVSMYPTSRDVEHVVDSHHRPKTWLNHLLSCNPVRWKSQGRVAVVVRACSRQGVLSLECFNKFALEFHLLQVVSRSCSPAKGHGNVNQTRNHIHNPAESHIKT